MQFYVELHPAGMGLLFHTSVSDIYDIGGVSSGPWMQGKKATMMREAFSKHNPMRPASLIHRSQPQASIRRVRSLRRRDLSKHPRSIPQNKCPSPRKANQQQEVCWTVTRRVANWTRKGLVPLAGQLGTEAGDSAGTEARAGPGAEVGTGDGPGAAGAEAEVGDGPGAKTGASGDGAAEAAEAAAGDGPGAKTGAGGDGAAEAAEAAAGDGPGAKTGAGGDGAAEAAEAGAGDGPGAKTGAGGDGAAKAAEIGAGDGPGAKTGARIAKKVRFGSLSPSLSPSLSLPSLPAKIIACRKLRRL